MDQQDIIRELVERVERLETAPARRRVHNMQQAALRLNMSVTKLRAELKAGRGPRHGRNGRIYTFSDEALDAYLAAQEHVA